jgi:predicted porin
MTQTTIVTRKYKANEVPSNKDLKFSSVGFKGGYHIGDENKPLVGFNETNIAVTNGSMQTTAPTPRMMYKPVCLSSRISAHF